MKFFKIFISMLVFAIASSSLAFSAHFTPVAGSSDNNMTVLLRNEAILKIGDTPIQANDEIAIYTAAGNCVGSVVWNEVQTAFPVLGFETNGYPLGPKSGDQLYFRIWDDANGVEYTSVSATVDTGLPLATPDTKYAPNGIMYINSIIAASVPGKPTFTNPLNQDLGVALSGTITINEASGADEHTIQLSKVNNFSSIVTSANGDLTSLSYSNLDNNTQYFARAKGTNEEGDGSWAEISFYTIMKTPTLSSPANNAKNQTESVTLTWSSVSGASSYTVQLSSDATFTVGVNEQSTAATNIQFNGLNNGTTFYWRVKATANNNNYSAYSSAFSFTTRLAATTITTPVNNATGIGTNGTVVWTAVNGATSYNVTITKVSGNIEVVNQNTTNTFYDYSNLEPYTNYVVSVYAKNNDGNGASSSANFRTIFGSPTLVSPANGSFNNEFSPQFTWNSVAGADKYDIRISTTQDFSANVTNKTDIATTNYYFAGLTPNTLYYWQVRGTSAEGVGGYSTRFEFTTKLASPTITSPANNATQIALINARIDWNNVSGATQYTVQLSKSPTFATIDFSDNSATNFIYFSGLQSKTAYYVRVKALNASNSSDFSSTVKFTTKLGQVTLSSPSNGSYSAPISGTLSWQNLAGANSYNVVVSTNSDLSSPIVNTNVASNSYNYNAFTKNTKYYWAISGVDVDGEGEPSSTWAFTTILAEPTLTTPANNSEGQVYSNLLLKWNVVASATKYHVQVSTTPSFNSLVVDNNNVNTNSFTVSSLNPFTNYYWRVKALNTNNSGDFSSAFTFKTIIGKVALSTPANGSEGFSTTAGSLTWTALNGAASYDVIVSENSNLSSPVVNTNTAGTTYNVPSGLLNTSYVYYWGVRAKDANGTYGEYSNTYSFGTLLTAPNLTSPSNGATDIAFNDLLKWNAVTRAVSYKVIIAKDAAFSNIVLNQDVNNTELELSNLESSTTYYWKVAGIVNSSVGNYSTTFSFQTMSLPPPVQIYPSNNAIDLYTSVDFVWSSVPEGVAYNFRYASDPNMQNILGTTNNINGTTYNLSGLFTNRPYFWQVQTVSNDGVSNWSDTYQFTTYAPIDFSGDETVCEHREGTYTAPQSDLVDYKWTVIGGSIVGSSTNNVVVVEWGNSGTGVVTLKRSSAIWGTYTDQLSMDVELTATINVNVNLTADTYNGNNDACVNEVFELSADISDSDFYEYAWVLNGAVISTDKSFDYSFSTAGEYTLNFYAIGNNCKSASSSITVDVSNNCSLTVVSAGDITTCKNSAPQIFIAVFGGSGSYSYSWTPAGDLISASVQNPIVKKASVTKTYSVIVTDQVTLIQRTASIKVTVSTTPSITFNPSTLMVYSNQAIDLTDEDVLLTTITGGTAPYAYSWKDDGGNPIDPTNVIPNFGRNYYHLTVADANGCESASKRFIVYNMANKGNIDGNLIVGITGEGVMMNYPNPTTDNLNIFVDFESKQNVRIRIMNMIGQNVYQEALGEIEMYNGNINVSKLSSGVYTLIVESDVNSFVNTFIKQ